jgi:hypothetical protein
VKLSRNGCTPIRTLGKEIEMTAMSSALTFGALAHVGQSHPTSLQRHRPDQSHGRYQVTTNRTTPSALMSDLHGNGRRVGMFERIIQRFLSDMIQCFFDDPAAAAAVHHR